MNEITYASKEEEYFHWYLQELIDAGYVDRIKYQPKPFPLSEKVQFIYQKQLKTKIKSIPKTLFREHSYQADFLIGWNQKAEQIFFFDIEGGNPLKCIFLDPYNYPFMSYYREYNTEHRSIVDVKGTFNQNDAWRRFSIEQKWVWQKFEMYVQKIIPIKLFKSTFTPQRYLLTDISNKPRKLDYKPITLDQFVSTKKAIS